MKKIEVEGGEFMIQSKEGHYAIIPAKDRNKVMKLLKDGCDDCINSYIKDLPRDTDYAEKGTVVSKLYEEKTGKPWKTAKEEGLTDGSYEQNIKLREKLLKEEPTNISVFNNNDNTTIEPIKSYDDAESFSKAFAEARKELGIGKVFLYKGKSYNTFKKEETIDNVQQQQQQEQQNTSQVTNTLQVQQSNSEQESNTETTETTVTPVKSVVQDIEKTKQQNEFDKEVLSYEFQDSKQNEEIDNVGLSLADYMIDLPEVEVKGKKGINSNVKLFEYNEPLHVKRLKRFQQEKGLNVTGVFDRATSALYYGNQVASTERYNIGLQLRNEYQQKVKEQAKDINYGSTFSMDPEIEKSLEQAGVKDISHCIGGVCHFLNSKVEKGIFSGGFTNLGFSRGSYFSNSAFEEAHQKEGWQKHNNFNYTKPDVGDILRVRYKNEAGRNHAMLVVDVEENPDPAKTRVVVLDNPGDHQARRRWFTYDELQKKYNTDDLEFMFYRRTRFGDIDLAEEQRAARNAVQKTPEVFAPEKYDHKNKTLNIQYNKEKEAPEIYAQYLEGINGINLEKYNDIPEADLQRIALITAAIPGNETEFGTGTKYKLKRNAPGLANQFRNLSTGEKLTRPLSTGLSQIDPTQISPRIKNKYFAAKNDNEIANQLRTNYDLQGIVSFEIMVERYRMYRDSNGSRYNNDPNKFWYSLITSWMSPNKGKSEKHKKNLDEYNWNYSNNIIENIASDINVIID